MKRCRTAQTKFARKWPFFEAIMQADICCIKADRQTERRTEIQTDKGTKRQTAGGCWWWSFLGQVLVACLRLSSEWPATDGRTLLYPPTSAPRLYIPDNSHLSGEPGSARCPLNSPPRKLR